MELACGHHASDWNAVHQWRRHLSTARCAEGLLWRTQLPNVYRTISTPAAVSTNSFLQQYLAVTLPVHNTTMRNINQTWQTWTAFDYNWLYWQDNCTCRSSWATRAAHRAPSSQKAGSHCAGRGWQAWFQLLPFRASWDDRISLSCLRGLIGNSNRNPGVFVRKEKHPSNSKRLCYNTDGVAHLGTATLDQWTVVKNALCSKVILVQWTWVQHKPQVSTS